jgi:hypothetical protein
MEFYNHGKILQKMQKISWIKPPLVSKQNTRVINKQISGLLEEDERMKKLPLNKQKEINWAIRKTDARKQ